LIRSFKLERLPDTLEEVCIQFETLEVFAEALDRLMAEMAARKIALFDMERLARIAAEDDWRGGTGLPHAPRIPSRHLSTEGVPLKISRWTVQNSEELKRCWSGHVGDLKDPLGQNMKYVKEIYYYVVEVTWKR
jgi:hypothetical protein